MRDPLILVHRKIVIKYFRITTKTYRLSPIQDVPSY